MPGIRKPTNVLELKGAFDKNPQRGRDRANEPKDDREIGNPPPGTPADVRAAWRELVKCAIPGVLTYADRPHLLAAAYLYSRLKTQRGKNDKFRQELIERIDEANLADPVAVADLLKDLVMFADRTSDWKPSDQANLTSLLARMGMNPADRSKIVLPKPKESNPFDDD